LKRQQKNGNTTKRTVFQHLLYESIMLVTVSCFAREVVRMTSEYVASIHFSWESGIECGQTCLLTGVPERLCLFTVTTVSSAVNIALDISMWPPSYTVCIPVRIFSCVCSRPRPSFASMRPLSPPSISSSLVVALSPLPFASP